MNRQPDLQGREISTTARLRTWPEELGLDRAVQLLEETIKEERATDQALTKSAEGVVNNLEAEGNTMRSAEDSISCRADLV